MLFFRFIYSFFFNKLIFFKFYLLIYGVIVFFYNFLKLKILLFPKTSNIKILNFPFFSFFLIYQTLLVIKIPKFYLRLPNIFLIDLNINFKDIFRWEFIHIDISNGLLEFAFFYYVPVLTRYKVGLINLLYTFYQDLDCQKFSINYILYTNTFLTLVFSFFCNLFNSLDIYNFFYLIFNFESKNYIRFDYIFKKLTNLQLLFFLTCIWLFFLFFFYRYVFAFSFYFIFSVTSLTKKFNFIFNYFNILIAVFAGINLFVWFIYLYVLNFYFLNLKKFYSLYKLFNLKIEKRFKLKFLIFKSKVKTLYKNYK